MAKATKRKVPRPKYVAEGFHDDAAKLLKDFIEANSLEFAVFAEKWRKHYFSLVFMGRSDQTENSEFTNELFKISAEFLLSPSLHMNVGAVYLLYSLYLNQISDPPIKIRLQMNHWKVISSLRMEAISKTYKSLQYVTEYLIKNSVKFVTRQMVMGPHTSVFQRASKNDYTLSTLKANFRTDIFEYADSNNLQELVDLETQYLEIKKKLNDDANKLHLDVSKKSSDDANKLCLDASKKSGDDANKLHLDTSKKSGDDALKSHLDTSKKSGDDANTLCLDTSQPSYAEFFEQFQNLVNPSSSDKLESVGNRRAKLKVKAFGRRTNTRFGKSAEEKICDNPPKLIKKTGLKLKGTRKPASERRVGRPRKNPRPVTPPVPVSDDEMDFSHLLSQQQEFYLPPIETESKKSKTTRNRYYKELPKQDDDSTNPDDIDNPV